MKFSVETKTITDIMNIISKVTKKDIQNISEQSDAVFISVQGGVVTIKTNQFDFNVVYTPPATDTKDGTVVLSVDTVSNVLNTLVDYDVTFELINKKVIITTKTSVSDVFILENAKGGGAVIEAPEKASFSINREILISGLRSVQHAASDTIIKPEIATVYVYSKDKTLYFVSTDSFRLAELRFQNEEVWGDFEVLIPKKSVSKLIATVENTYETDIQFYVDGGVVMLQTEAVLVKMNSVTGSFPDYKKILPTEFDAHIAVLKKDVQVFLKKARIFTNNLNRMMIRKSDDKSIVLSFENESIGSTQNILPAEIDGNIEEIPSFNYKFVADALNVVESDTVVFSVLNNPTKPVMIRGSQNQSLTLIISPLIT